MPKCGGRLGNGCGEPVDLGRHHIYHYQEDANGNTRRDASGRLMKVYYHLPCAGRRCEDAHLYCEPRPTR